MTKFERWMHGLHGEKLLLGYIIVRTYVEFSAELVLAQPKPAKQRRQVLSKKLSVLTSYPIGLFFFFLFYFFFFLLFLSSSSS
jgi:hypothetical protein